jgi:predicted ATPase/DNA-binding winged helix-turn-helix (wHTH) protein
MPQCWRFTAGTRSFRLYPERHQLWCGDARVEIGSRPFALLVVLAANAGRVVSREQLLELVWQSRSASETTISSQVSILRHKLGVDDCIVAVNNQGYVLTLSVTAEDDVPPVPAPQAVRPLISLPHPSGTGIGRATELAELAVHCVQQRLVTVTGPGGVGKTWLAIALGWRLSQEFPDGMHLIDLGPAKEPLAVAGTLAQALGVALRRSDDPARVLATAIGPRRMLLILDSCEYVAETVRELVKGLLAQAPNLSILATSQAILGLPKEVVVPLDPLSSEDAAALFVECVQAAGRRVQPNERTAAAIAEICRRLDGIPLALEMAAAQVPTLGIEGVRDGLQRQRFRMLDSQPRLGEARQATLSGVVEWSHGLLDEADRQAFRRIARFRGSFTRDAAVAVAGADGADEWDIAARLGRLVGRSLLVAEDGDRPRYRMLETLSLYAAAKLTESGEGDKIAESHALFYMQVFERADLAWETTSEADWVAAYRPDIDNVRAALDWALSAPNRVPLAMILAGVAGHLWVRLGLNIEGRGYLDRLVEIIDADTPPADAARVLRCAAMLSRRTDRPRSVALAERSVAIYRQIGDRLNLGAALGLLGSDYIVLGRHAEAKAILGEARELLSGTSSGKSLQGVVNDLGSLALLTNEPDEAQRCYTAARDLARRLNDSLREYIALNNLGELRFRVGAINQAIEYVRQAAAGFRALERPFYLGPVLVNLASYLTLQNEAGEARDVAAEALSLLRIDGGQWLRLCLQLWALIGAREGRYVAAAQLIGFVDAGFVRSGEARQAPSQWVFGVLSELLTANLGDDDIRAWAKEGASWGEDQAVAFTLQRLVPSEDFGELEYRGE